MAVAPKYWGAAFLVGMSPEVLGLGVEFLLGLGTGHHWGLWVGFCWGLGAGFHGALGVGFCWGLGLAQRWLRSITECILGGGRAWLGNVGLCPVPANRQGRWLRHDSTQEDTLRYKVHTL